MRWTLIAPALVLLIWGWFVLGFLDEPSAVGRVRAALLVIGVGSAAVGAGAAVVGVTMLFARSRKSRRT